MSRREEIVNNIGYKMTRAALEYVEKHEFADAIDAFEAGAEWMQEKMVEKAIEYAKARYDLDYCGNVRDILDYLKSLTEE
jgi:hypothetical protein